MAHKGIYNIITTWKTSHGDITWFSAWLSQWPNTMSPTEDMNNEDIMATEHNDGSRCHVCCVHNKRRNSNSYPLLVRTEGQLLLVLSRALETEHFLAGCNLYRQVYKVKSDQREINRFSQIRVVTMWTRKIANKLQQLAAARFHRLLSASSCQETQHCLGRRKAGLAQPQMPSRLALTPRQLARRRFSQE